MHLWPSTRIRDSFKIGYLTKLEWNLHRMNNQKNQSQSNQEKLLDDQGIVVDTKDPSFSNNSCLPKYALLCRELIMILSCCYCCFGCGACVDQGEH